MRAAIRESFGNSDQIKIVETEKPSPKKKEVLVKISYNTVNRTDEGVLTGKPLVFRLFVGFKKPRRPILGTDFSGEVTQVGSDVKHFKVGDFVFGFNDQGGETQAEYLTINENGNILKVPKDVDLKTAVASIEGPHYALNFINKTKVKKGDEVLVNGATGGIGSALTQILIAKDVKVTAVCDTKNIHNITSLGATKVIDYTNEDFTKLNKKFDYIFDAVGKSYFKACKPILKDRGVYISSELGPNSENLYLPLTTLFNKKRVKFPFPKKIKKTLEIMSFLLEAKQYTPLIDSEFDFSDIKLAYDKMLTKMKTGNVIVKH